MTTFKEIRGKLIRTLDTDPTPSANYVGEIWYNKTIGVLKGSTFTAAAWSAGGNLGTARYGVSSGPTGTQNDAFASLGYDGSDSVATEEYNGSTWTAGGNAALGRLHSGAAGTVPAGLAFGGYDPSTATYRNETEEYNGSSWTSGGNLPLAITQTSGAGTQTAALSMGGAALGDPASQTNSNEYNGSAWGSSAALNTARFGGSGGGTQTAGIFNSGEIPGPNAFTNATEEYDGTSWTSGNNSNYVNKLRGSAGIQTALLGFGGLAPPVVNTTESYDGTSWTTLSATLAVARRSLGGTGTQTAGLAFAGNPPGTGTNSTEEYNAAFYSTKTLTTS